MKNYDTFTIRLELDEKSAKTKTTPSFYTKFRSKDSSFSSKVKVVVGITEDTGEDRNRF